ncbi:hypothetical protein DIPPA_13028 [Diplonema papillatum]|nr:hypothetical protein DIPPA_13921 [Diplonema papillatum]KAJ9454017.1 hypothetical protein DIPPA_13028 [Diplonema papillatum]
MRTGFMDPEWEALVRSLAKLPEGMPLTSFRMLPCWALPEPRPAEEVYKRFRSMVAELGAGPRERGPAPGGDGVKDTPPRSPPGQRARRWTPQRAALKRSLSRNSAEVARRAMRARYTTVGSKATYDSNTAGYVSWCGSMGVEPYPTTVERLEEFGGHLLLMGDDGAAYRAPQNIIASVLAENKAAGCVLDDPLNIVGRMMAVLGKESPDPQQAEPLGVKEFRAIFDAIRTTGDYGAALQILGEFFTLLRTSSMRAIRAEDITLSGGRLRVEWRMAKGKRECVRFLTFEAINLVPPLTLSDPPEGAPSSIRFCPVEVFTLLKRLAGSSQLLCPNCGYRSFREALCGTRTRRGLFADINGMSAGRSPGSRLAYTTHSARVGGCCTLLKAGMGVMQVCELGDWASEDMVRLYGKKLTRDPYCVEAVRFYNPVSLAHCYAAPS